MNEQPSNSRRVLVTLIIGLVIVQSGILIYLGFSVLPRLSSTEPGPTQAPQFELPVADRTVSPGDQEKFHKKKMKKKGLLLAHSWPGPTMSIGQCYLMWNRHLSTSCT